MVISSVPSYLLAKVDYIESHMAAFFFFFFDHINTPFTLRLFASSASLPCIFALEGENLGKPRRFPHLKASSNSVDRSMSYKDSEKNKKGGGDLGCFCDARQHLLAWPSLFFGGMLILFPRDRVIDGLKQGPEPST